MKSITLTYTVTARELLQDKIAEYRKLPIFNLTDNDRDNYKQLSPVFDLAIIINALYRIRHNKLKLNISVKQDIIVKTGGINQ